jgi:hypothetical protein
MPLVAAPASKPCPCGKASTPTSGPTGSRSPPGWPCGMIDTIDNGSQDMSDLFQAELRLLGSTSSPAFVREPEVKGCAERVIRTPQKTAPLSGALRHGGGSPPGPARLLGALQPRVAPGAAWPSLPDGRPRGVRHGDRRVSIIEIGCGTRERRWGADRNPARRRRGNRQRRGAAHKLQALDCTCCWRNAENFTHGGGITTLDRAATRQGCRRTARRPSRRRQ